MLKEGPMNPIKAIANELRWLGRAIRPTRKSTPTVLSPDDVVLHAAGQTWIRKADGTMVRAKELDTQQ